MATRIKNIPAKKLFRIPPSLNIFIKYNAQKGIHSMLVAPK